MIAMKVPVTSDDPSIRSCVLSYDENADRYAIGMTFAHDDGDVVPWLVGRELLTATLLGPHGAAGHDGDILVVALPDVVDVTLRVYEQRCTVTFARADLDAFYAVTTAAVPLGTEMDNVDIDAELLALLADVEGEL